MDWFYTGTAATNTRSLEKDREVVVFSMFALYTSKKRNAREDLHPRVITIPFLQDRLHDSLSKHQSSSKNKMDLLGIEPRTFPTFAAFSSLRCKQMLRENYTTKPQALDNE